MAIFARENALEQVNITGRLFLLQGRFSAGQERDTAAFKP